MTYFTQIDPTNTARFADRSTGEVLAVYDRHGRGTTYYAPVGVDEAGRICFVGAPRTMWSDELEVL